MRNLLNLIARYNNIIIFLILEGIAFSLLSSENSYHNIQVVKGIRGLTFGIDKTLSNTRSYFRLRENVEILSIENSSLRNRIEQLEQNEDNLFFSVSDTVYKQQYIWTSAEVVNNSVNRQKNFFTLNKGYNQNLATDMAVISDDGVAGMIVGCSSNYSVAMSLLNIDFRLSARLRSNGYFGSLSWDGKDSKHAVLNDIPQHVNIVAGDTVETTGYSAIFPEGLMVGIIEDIQKSGSNFYSISVLLKTDFKKLHFVNVIGNLHKTEQRLLEKQFQ